MWLLARHCIRGEDLMRGEGMEFSWKEACVLTVVKRDDIDGRTVREDGLDRPRPLPPLPAPAHVRAEHHRSSAVAVHLAKQPLERAEISRGHVAR